MKDKVLLSICIPTYNRERFLDEAIRSIVEQISPDMSNKVELCISDNASTDNTDFVVEKWKRISNISIIYNKNNENIGADRNFLKVIEIANGKYCWLLGSDDKIRKGAIKRILSEIKNGYDIYLCNRIECDYEMNPLRRRYWLDKKIKEDMVFELSDKGRFLKYLSLSEFLGAIFSYISSLIIKKENWDEVGFDESFVGTAYSHVYKIISIIHSKPICRLKYIVEPLVLNREGNDSFSEGGYISRVMLDIEGYIKIANYFFDKDREIKKYFLKVLHKEYPWYRIWKIFATCKVERGWNIDKIEYNFHTIGYNKFLLRLLKISGFRFYKFILLLDKVKYKFTKY